MVRRKTPTLADIKNSASETDLRALLYIAICEVCDFFNVGKNMNDVQIATTVDLIIENYWHLRLEEIKFCLRRAMRREKLFDRLDGNIILGWIGAYDDERTEEAMAVSEEEDTKMQQAEEAGEPVTFEEYIAQLRSRANNGDGEAKERIADIEQFRSVGNTKVSSREMNNSQDFKKYFYCEYLKNKKNGEHR